MDDDSARQAQPGAATNAPSNEPPAGGSGEAPQPGAGDAGDASQATPPRALPASTGRAGTKGLGEWVARTLDVVDIMADAARDAVLGVSKR